MSPRLSHRRGYIGGGNIAGILGVSPYKSPLDEYLVITGQADQEDESREAFFKRRKALEPFAGEVFEQRTGLQIVARNQRYDDAEHGFLKAEIDFEVSDGCNGETKTVHPLAASEWGDPGTDEIPVYVTAQAMHGLGVRPRVKAVWIHALIGLDDDRIYRIERDDETIAAMRARAVEFWNQHVLPGVPPEPTSVEDVKRMFAKDSGYEVEPDTALLATLNRLRDLQATLKPLTQEFEDLKLQAQLAMRDASAVVVDGKTLVTWKAQQCRRFNQAAFAEAHPALFEQFKHTSTTRVFRLK